MNKTVVVEKIKYKKFGRMPVVMVPLADWRTIESKLEDYEMLRSERYLRSVEESRKQIMKGKLYGFDAKTGKFKNYSKR